MIIKANPSLIITPINGIPDIQEGDALDVCILSAINEMGLLIENGDILVLAQKIVSKSEGCYFNYGTLEPTPYALELSEICGKDAQFVQLVLNESNQVVRAAAGVLIVEHKSGFVSANAGIDHSNINKNITEDDKWALLIPKDADASAEKLRLKIKERTGKDVGVLIIDSHGRAWRYGTVGITIGLSGIDALIDQRGDTDLYGNVLHATIIAAADELAAGASLVMGQKDEGTPVILVKGYPYPSGNGKLSDLIRSKDNDLFR